MNGVQLHLMVNHLPVVGLFWSLGLLAYAKLRRAEPLRRVSLGFVLIVTLTALPAYFSGESAEEMIEGKPGISEALIEAHEELAELALALTLATGFVALASLVFWRRSSLIAIWGFNVTLVAAVAATVVLGLTANAGGTIGHPELRDSAVARPAGPPGAESTHQPHSDSDAGDG